MLLLHALRPHPTHFAGRAARLPALRLPICSELLSHVRIGLSVCGFLWYCYEIGVEPSQ